MNIMATSIVVFASETAEKVPEYAMIAEIKLYSYGYEANVGRQSHKPCPTQ